MTDIRIVNWNNNPDARLRTELTLKVQVPLNIEDIRSFVHIIDEENAGEGEGISPANVTAIDFITLWLEGTYTGTAMMTVDEMMPI